MCMKVMVSDVWKVEWGLFESERVCFCLCFAALLGHFERSGGVVRAGRGGGEAVAFFLFFRVFVHGIVRPNI